MELIDDDDTFRIRMAVPGFFKGGLRVMVNESAIDVLSEETVLIRRISFPEQLDLRSVSATLHDGYLHITGAKAADLQKRMAKAASKPGS
jgi:HSP20 family molecular chaperone IbpA